MLQSFSYNNIGQHVKVSADELEVIPTSLGIPEPLKNTNADCPLRGEIFQDTHLSKAEKRTDLIYGFENLFSLFLEEKLGFYWLIPKNNLCQST